MDEMNGGLHSRRPKVLPPSPEDKSIPRHLSHLSNTVTTIERRLLHLIKESTEGAVALDDFVSELSLLTKDLEGCYHQIADLRGRRDLTFDTNATLEELDRCCVWLYKKTYLEQAFFKKLHLERRLRSLISAEAYEVYQELLNVDEEEGEVLGKGPAEIRRLLLRDDTCLLPPNG